MSDLPQGELLRWQAFNAKAITAVQTGNPGAAIPLLEEALSVKEDAYVLGNYGDALARCGRLEEARAAFVRSIALKPDYDQSHYNLGVVLDNLEDLDGAREAYLRAIDCRVTPAALNNLANAETHLLRLDDAECHYRAAVKHGYTDARWNLSLCLMMQGKWREGWDLYHFRPQMSGACDGSGMMWRDHPQLWRGERLAGKTLVILTEQGLGDSIYSFRFLPVLREMGVKLVVSCEATLKRVVEAMCPPEEHLAPVRVIDRQTTSWNEPYDYVTLAMSIPGYLTPEGVGPAAPYLKARGVRMEGFNVGLCWNGSTIVGPPKERNIPLKLLEPLSKLKGVKLVSLQRGNAVDEIEDCGFEVVNAMANVRDVHDTACVIASLDMVVTVDTLIPHLAGALGRPVWLINRHMSCWQWGTENYDPHLYATVAQFRQAKRREWGPVVEQITYGLEHVLRERERAFA